MLFSIAAVLLENALMPSMLKAVRCCITLKKLRIGATVVLRAELMVYLIKALLNILFNPLFIIFKRKPHT
jgi:hypothetical protein